MDDNHKTRQELMAEVLLLQSRIAALEQNTRTANNHLSPAGPAHRDDFREIFQKSLDVQVIVAAGTQRILHISDQVESLLGYRPGRLIGKEFSVFFPPEPSGEEREFFEQIRAFDAVLVDQPFLHRDGSIVLVDLTATIVNWPDEQVFLVNIRDTRERRRAEAVQQQLIGKLQSALEKVKLLQGLLPICAHCKKIRDDHGYWQQIEDFIRTHSEAEFSHSICPDCIKEHYADLDLDAE